jgi:hypothetical protein
MEIMLLMRRIQYPTNMVSDILLPSEYILAKYIRMVRSLQGQ